jgi:TonB family protein
MGAVSRWPEADFKIVNYWDSLGNKIVSKGIGLCDCSLISGRREKGKVVNGLRDSTWLEYSSDSLVIKEIYSLGKLKSGERYEADKISRYDSLDVQASFIGGYEKMMDYIKKTLRYPADARRSGVDGTVYIAFEIHPNGTIAKVKTVKSVSESTDAEAIRVVKLSDRMWSPATLRGRPISTRFVLPLRFKLN